MYFDSAATSFPKPKKVIKGVEEVLVNKFGSYNRSSDTELGDLIYLTRKKIADFFNIRFANSIVFTQNATESLNIVINGVLAEGDEVITTATEHNSVIRPLLKLSKERNLKVHFVECNNRGFIDQNKIIELINDHTKLVIVNQGSNVTGAIQEINKVSEIVSNLSNSYLLVDISQTAGHINVDNQVLKADFLAFTGHKGLMGIQGIGGLYINPEILISPLKVGGTGVLSELLVQPHGTPIHYEAGTPNIPGISSLFWSIDFILNYSYL